MAPWIKAINEFAQAWSGRMWHASFEGALVVAATWLLCRTFNRVPARFKCWLWRIACAKLLLGLFWPVPIEIALLPARPAPPLRDRLAGSGQILSFHQTDADKEALRSMGAAHSAGWNLNLATCVLACWVLGGLVYAVRLLRLYSNSAGWRTDSRPVRDNATLACYEQLCQRLGVNRPPRLLCTAGATGPFLTGIIRPAIILPASLLHSPDPKSLRLILAHELAHLRRGDVWWNLLPSLGNLLFYFHPLMPLAWRETRLAQEIACDELALAISDALLSEYAEMLVKVAEGLAPTAVINAVGTVESFKALERRIAAMKQFSLGSSPFALTTGAIIVLCSLAAVLPWRVVARNAPPDKAEKRARVVAPSQLAATNSPAEEEIPLVFQGTIQPDAKIEVRTPVEGLIEQVGFREGSPVKKGQVLIQLANSTLSAEVTAAQTELKNAELVYRRLRGVEDNHAGLVSQEDLDKAESTLAKCRAELEIRKEQIGRTRITAPCDGTMGASEIRLGEYVTPKTLLGILYDLSSFKVQFDVSANYLSQLRLGQTIQVHVEDTPSKQSLEGKVYFIAPAIDEATHTAQVKARLATNLRLWAGMHATVTLTLPSKAGDEK